LLRAKGSGEFAPARLVKCIDRHISDHFEKSFDGFDTYQSRIEKAMQRLADRSLEFGDTNGLARGTYDACGVR
jgi:hypothetical protein